MYIPKNYLMQDQAEILAFMQRYSFGTLVTSESGIPVATHLPFLCRELEGKLIISSHLATTNPQASTLVAKDVLVIFSEPHAYISPRFYEKQENVPTWNYLAVHAYGKAELIEDEAGKFHLLENTILTYEKEYLDQWTALSDDYKRKMLKGIVAFEIQVTELQGKKKLSQNKTKREQQNIIDAFSFSNDPNQVQLAEYMKSNLK